MANSMGAPRQAGAAPSGKPLGQMGALRHESSSISLESPTQGMPQQSREPSRSVDDTVTRGWSPLQKPAQTRPVKQDVSYPAVTATPGHECGSAGQNTPGIVCSFDFHVSFAEQSLPQTTPPASGRGLSSLPYQHPVSPWSDSQIATSSCTTTNRSLATEPLIHTPASAPRSLPQGCVPDPPPSHHIRRGFEREVRRMLLLNAYPTLYVLLWIPGIVNRFMEATGTSPSNTRIVGALQSTSQFVGFANALTFGLSTTMRRRIASAAPRSKWVGRTTEEAGER